MPNKITRFWQELRHRNVPRVLAVYVAAAFMVLELPDMISEPFGLPGWSIRAGFFILLSDLVIRMNLVRSDPGSQQIVRAAEAKYQTEHRRVRQWLEEKAMR